MRPKLIIWILTGVILASTVVVAWRAHAAANAAALTTAELRSARLNLEASLQKQEAELATRAKHRADLQAALDEAKSKAPKKSAARESSRQRIDKLTQNPMALIAKDPKLQVLYLASKRASIAASHGPLFRKLGLSPRQIEQLAEVMTKAEEQQQDVAAIQHDQKLPPDDPSLVTLRRQARDELLAAETDILGAEGVEKLQGYARMLPGRAVVDRFAGAAALANVPLTTLQADRLAQAIAEKSPAYQSGSTVDVVQVNWAELDAQSVAFLTPAQQALFRSIEPLGGGVSRWNARFSQAMQQALAKTRAPSDPSMPGI
jgi:hypothetical protein